MRTFIPTRNKRIDLTSEFVKRYPLHSINEQIIYSPEVPYSLAKQDGINQFILPHFSDTLEIMISCGAEGDFIIDGKPVTIYNDSILFILPHIIHGGYLRFPNNGYLFNLKISLKNLQRYIHIENFMNKNGYQIDDLALSKPDYALVVQELEHLIYVDSSIYERSAQILRLFNLFEEGIPSNPIKPLPNSDSATSLHKLLTWTSQHFQENITLDDAAKITHLSRCYFSRYFKEKTGITYFQYLNQVRISHAIECLISGKTTIESCYESGFRNVSYFIQQFKKVTGLTTQEYLNKLK